MKRILIPVDFSEVSKDAVKSAATLARKSGGDLVLFHVVENYVVIDETRAKAESFLAMKELDGITCHYKQSTGDAVDEIVAQQLDVIVMGSEGATGVKNFFMSTLSEKVSRQATCPVINVKEYVDLGKVKSIVFPTDMNDDQAAVIKDIIALQSFYNAHLHLIKIYGEGFILEKDVKERLEKFARLHKLEDYSITVRPNIDKAEEILDFAYDINATMIAMGIHNRHGLDKILNGFISKDVINEGKIAIWTKVIR